MFRTFLVYRQQMADGCGIGDRFMGSLRELFAVIGGGLGVIATFVGMIQAHRSTRAKQRSEEAATEAKTEARRLRDLQGPLRAHRQMQPGRPLGRDRPARHRRRDEVGRATARMKAPARTAVSIVKRRLDY